VRTVETKKPKSALKRTGTHRKVVYNAARSKKKEAESSPYRNEKRKKPPSGEEMEKENNLPEKDREMGKRNQEKKGDDFTGCKRTLRKRTTGWTGLGNFF